MKPAQLKHSLVALIILLLGLFITTSVWADAEGRYRGIGLEEGGASAGGGSLAPPGIPDRFEGGTHVELGKKHPFSGSR